MNTKAVALAIAFAALAIALNPAISGIGLPFPPTPGLIFNLWEIVIITAFFLTGLKGGISVALLNALFLLAVYPGQSRPLYPLTNTLAVSTMMVGTYLANILLVRRSIRPSSGRIVVYYTAFSMLFRILIMAPGMYGLQRLIGTPATIIVNVILPFQAVYNIVMALYTIPIAYFVAKAVNKNLKFNSPLI